MASRAKRVGAVPSQGTQNTPRRPSAPEPAEVSGNTSLDVDALRQIVEILEASDVTRLVWRRGRERLYIRRGQPPAPTQYVSHVGAVTAHPISAQESRAAASSTPAHAPPPSGGPAPAAAPAPAPAGHVVTSPFVGTFYRTPAPDQPAFVDINSVIRKGQVLCIIEAMKLMNEIESEVAGRVVEILVDNGTPVEFGQALFRIEPA